MTRNLIINTQFGGQGHATVDYLRQEIAFFEMRLAAMGERGDCAYERALSKAYRLLLRQRRQQLARL